MDVGRGGKRPQSLEVMMQDWCWEVWRTRAGKSSLLTQWSHVTSSFAALCCWTTDACDVSDASSKSAWQEGSHLSVTFLCYLIMIRCDDVVTSCEYVVQESLIELCGWKAKTVIFHRKSGLFWGPKWNSYRKSFFWVRAPKSTVSFTVGNVQFVLERHFGSCWSV